MLPVRFLCGDYENWCAATKQPEILYPLHLHSKVASVWWIVWCMDLADWQIQIVAAVFCVFRLRQTHWPVIYWRSTLSDVLKWFLQLSGTKKVFGEDPWEFNKNEAKPDWFLQGVRSIFWRSGGELSTYLWPKIWFLVDEGLILIVVCTFAPGFQHQAIFVPSQVVPKPTRKIFMFLLSPDA